MFIYLFYLFLAVRSGRDKRGLLCSCSAGASGCGGVSGCGARLQGEWASVVAARGLRRDPPRHVGSSPTRDRTCVPCIARRILNHWTTREAPLTLLLDQSELCISSSHCLLKWPLYTPETLLFLPHHSPLPIFWALTIWGS